jgi:hypothetical protein
MSKTSIHLRSLCLLLAALVAGKEYSLAQAKPSASGTLAVQLQNGSGLRMIFQSDASGVVLGNAGTSTATLGLGTISAYGPLGSAITKTVGASTFTVSTIFDVSVQESGLASTSYTLAAALSGAAPAGVTYQIDSVVLSTTGQSIQANAVYGNNVAHTFSAIVSTAASGAGGPVTGTQLSSTINFTATAN